MERNINILFVAYQFPPLNVGGSLRPFMFAKYLPYHGINPTVLTLDPKCYSKIYPNANIDSKPLNDLPKEVAIEFIKSKDLINKQRKFPYNKIPEVFNEGFFWKKDFFRSSENLLSKKEYKAILVTAPPFSVLNLARKLSKKHNIPLIVDLRDHWSLWVTNPYKTYLHFLLTKKMESAILKFANAVIVTSKVTKTDLINLYPSLSTEKLYYIPNGLDKPIQTTKIIFTPKEKITIGYVGSFYFDPASRDMLFKEMKEKKGIKKLQFTPRKEDWLYRSPFYFFKTIRELFDKHPDFQKKIEIVFAGEQKKWFKDMINEFNLGSNVNHLGWLSRDEAAQFQKNCDFLLLTSSKVINGKDYSIAGKTFEYIEFQKPVLAFVTNSAQKDILEKTGNSIIFDPDNIENSVSKLHRIFNNGVSLSLNKTFIQKHDRKKLTKKLADLIYQI
jgi:glycosyltransferase involved in cell wall biosynthesis